MTEGEYVDAGRAAPRLVTDRDREGVQVVFLNGTVKPRAGTYAQLFKAKAKRMDKTKTNGIYNVIYRTHEENIDVRMSVSSWRT